MTKILLDMNYPAFQEQLFIIEKQEQRALLTTLKKIKQLEWEELYKYKDIRWELITSKTTSKGNNVTKISWHTVYRDGNYLVLLALFPDHDGAYI
ncbi:MAG TPA: hypothetical protein LFW10_05050 [Rickettsia endosymbiont of Diachasma alloeum]|nr:hypothetical protein [Rickettsia endosymbiont of Diachasma alloeum]